MSAAYLTGGYLTGDRALAAIVLWHSGQFDTAAIASLLSAREDAVWRTLHATRDTARRYPPPVEGGGVA